MRMVQNSGTTWPVSVNCVTLLPISQKLVVHHIFHSFVNWQGTIAHVVAVIWKRLHIMVIGTSFHGCCVPDGVIQLGH